MKLPIFIFLLVGAASACEICKLFLLSPSRVKNYSFFPLTSNTLEFNLRCAEDAHILLSIGDNYEEDPTYEFVLGTQKNTYSVLRRDKKDVARHDGPILDGKTFRSFKIVIDPESASLTLIANGNKTLIHYEDANFITMSRFAFASYNENTAEFHYRCDQTKCAGNRFWTI